MVEGFWVFVCWCLSPGPESLHPVQRRRFWGVSRASVGDSSNTGDPQHSTRVCAHANADNHDNILVGSSCPGLEVDPMDQDLRSLECFLEMLLLSPTHSQSAVVVVVV